MDIFDFGSPALQAMSVPAIAVLVALAVLTLRSMTVGDRATLLRSRSSRRVDPSPSTSSVGADATDFLNRRG